MSRVVTRLDAFLEHLTDPDPFTRRKERVQFDKVSSAVRRTRVRLSSFLDHLADLEALLRLGQ